MKRITLTLTNAQEAGLRQLAKDSKMSPSELARLLISKVMIVPNDTESTDTVEYVVGRYKYNVPRAVEASVLAHGREKRIRGIVDIRSALGLGLKEANDLSWTILWKKDCEAGRGIVGALEAIDVST